VFDVQFDVGGELAVVTVGAQVVRTADLNLADGSEDALGAHFPVVGPIAATTRQSALIGGWLGEAQEFGQRRGARLV